LIRIRLRARHASDAVMVDIGVRGRARKQAMMSTATALMIPCASAVGTEPPPHRDV
jgi:hypothetical protein